jgi:hypothetical protein
VYTAIACASEPDLRELREIARADADALEEFRPWGVDLAADAPASESLEDARSMLTYRHLSNAEACSGFADWAHGFAGMVAEHALSPVLRIGAVAWLTCVALPPEKQVAWVEVVALEAAGWHVVELRPSGTDELALWRVTIQRYDTNMTMTLQEADPDVALEELVRYVQVDAR